MHAVKFLLYIDCAVKFKDLFSYFSTFNIFYLLLLEYNGHKINHENLNKF